MEMEKHGVAKDKPQQNETTQEQMNIKGRGSKGDARPSNFGCSQS